MKVELTRNESNADGVFGVMRFGALLLYTCEEDWKDNKPNESCIPAGQYKLKRRWSNKHKCEVFEVMDVPKRKDIEIHIGNTEEDTLGCILIGTRKGTLRRKDEDTGEVHDKQSVVNSTQAFNAFMAAMAQVDESEILIVWSHGQP